MKGSPPVAGGSLKSKPTWSNTCGVFHHVGFFLRERRIVAGGPEYRKDDWTNRNEVLAARLREVRLELKGFEVSIDHHELRLAVGRFLDAKRALNRAYREYCVAHSLSVSMPVPDWEASNPAGNDSVLSVELLELNEEIQRLRKSLALLQTYCLRVQEQRDTLLVATTIDLERWGQVTVSSPEIATGT